MNGNKQLQKIVLAASLAAVSVVIDVFFKYVLNIQHFGVPFYAIPIIIGSIVLGPLYGVIMGFIGDGIGVMIAGEGYLPLYVIGPMIWGLMPGLLLHKKYSPLKLGWAIPLTYVLVSLSNTLAGVVYFGSEVTILYLYLRLSLIPFNSVIMFVIIKDVYRKLSPFTERYTLEPQKT
ncbi:MAG: folate family ECF transporter S component [Firmicutes bacterium]|nr:folate family ECF transporter S component [Bacillota bacterium]